MFTIGNCCVTLKGAELRLNKYSDSPVPGLTTDSLKRVLWNTRSPRGVPPGSSCWMPGFKMPEPLVSRFVVKQLLSFWKLLWLGFSDSCSISYAKCSNTDIKQRSENSFCTPGRVSVNLLRNHCVSQHCSLSLSHLLTALYFQGKKSKTEESLWCSRKGEVVEIISNVAFGLPKLREQCSHIPRCMQKALCIWELWFTHFCAL